MVREKVVSVGKRAAVISVGLALGAGAMTLYRSQRGPTYHPPPPSVKEFSFPAVAPDLPAGATDFGPAPKPDVEPVDAKAALTAFLQSLADGKPDAAYPLIDGPGRTRFPTPATWLRAQADMATPLTFVIGTNRSVAERPGAVDFDVSATHRPSLDSVRGLVPGQSQSVWEVRPEGDTWRVGPQALSFRPVLPADASATQVVQTWVDRLAACDTTAAAELQVDTSLYGPIGLVRSPCEKHGDWSAGAPVGLDRTPDPKAFLAAFGPEVGTWARLVPVQGSGSRFLAAVAPMGDHWQVMGVAVAG